MMTQHKILYRFFFLTAILGLSICSNAQISAPGRDWSDTTKYTKLGIQQDSIFVFFSSMASPKKGSLKARFSDGTSTNFHWYKYDQSKPIASRFISFAVENGVLESNLTNLDKGGYKVIMTRTSDLAVDSSSCWVFIDSVKITGVTIDNRCAFLELTTNTLPTKLNILNYSVFSYWDFKSSKTYHRISDELSRSYFNTIVWSVSNSQVQIPSQSNLVLTVADPSPYYDSKYKITVTNPFGRILSSETPTVTAIATKADFTLFVDKEGDNNWTEETKGEAPLNVKFDTKSIGADSVYWQIINDVELIKKGGDSIVWHQGYLAANGFEIIPVEKLLPGKFNIEHIAVKVASGCSDTMRLVVEVDTSYIKPDAIPNVFSPNDDGVNDLFIIKDIEANTASIKSFRISILSRQGVVVYSYSGSSKDWKGWDGKMNGSNRDTPEGVYYFIIDAVGWDDKSFKRGPYKGFLYLYRGK